jgi:hypothetical protein
VGGALRTAPWRVQAEAASRRVRAAVAPSGPGKRRRQVPAGAPTRCSSAAEEAGWVAPRELPPAVEVAEVAEEREREALPATEVEPVRRSALAPVLVRVPSSR